LHIRDLERSKGMVRRQLALDLRIALLSENFWNGGRRARIPCA
jgi:hypothetical protein